MKYNFPDYGIFIYVVCMICLSIDVDYQYLFASHLQKYWSYFSNYARYQAFAAVIFCVKGRGRYIQTAYEDVASLTNVECKSKYNQELVVLLNVLFIDRPVYLTNKLIP